MAIAYLGLAAMYLEEGEYLWAAPPSLESLRLMRKLEADNIRVALERAGGKVSGPGGAAELLGIRPTTLASRIKALGVSNRSRRVPG